MTLSELRKLQDLAEQGKARDLAAYAKYVQRHGEMLRDIQSLDSRVKNSQDTNDLTVMARWQIWAAQERLRLTEAANAMEAEKENARKIAIKSTAKVQALGILLKDALKTQLILNRRRAEQNGMPPDA